jgi:hypothetical protein
MLEIPMEVYLDYSLRKKIDTIVINANEIKTQQSDVNVFYITNGFKVKDDGAIVNHYLKTPNTFFIRFIDEAGDINFRMIKSAHFGNIIESDFETTSFYPSNPEEYANYYEGKEVPPEGDWLYFAYCPFGENHIELLNGEIIKTCGGIGKVWITPEQRGFKGYKQVPKIDKLFEIGPYKILKLVIATQWEKHGPQSYSVNIFAPSYEEVEEELSYQIKINDDILFYTKADAVIKGSNYIALKNFGPRKGYAYYNGEQRDGSPLKNLDKHIYLEKNGYINVSSFTSRIKDTFSLVLNFSVYEYARKGTILFEGAYGIDAAGNQTHHLTLWLNSNGELCYNSKYNDEAINTKAKVEKNTFNTLIFVWSNVKLVDNDPDMYMGFIFLNGKQIWPKETLLNPDEKLVLKKGYEVFQTYTNVCLKLETNMAIAGALDAKSVCIKKLLKESGFVNVETLNMVYSLYLKRPQPTSVDVGSEFSFGSDDKTIISPAYIGQDAYRDLLDSEYYFNGEIYDIAIIGRDLTRDEVNQLNLVYALGFTGFKVD